MSEEQSAFDKLWPFNPPGFIHVTGPRGIGKTTFAIDVGVNPNRICVLDGEASAKDYDRQLHFGEYHDLIEETAATYGLECTDLQYYLYCRDILDNIPEGKFDVLVFDNILRFENGLVVYANEHHENFGISKGQMKGMPALIWGAVKSLYQALIVAWSAKVRMFIVTTPTGEKWVHSKPSGQQKPKGKDVLEWLTSLRIWLRFKENSKVPAGLVLKDRVTKMEFHEGKGIEKISVLPRRLDPCTWEQIRYYMANPANHSKPLPSEIPTADDWAVLKGTLTDEKRLQLKVLELQLEAVARAEKNNRIDARVDAHANGPKFAADDEDTSGKIENGSGSESEIEIEVDNTPFNIAELITKAFAELQYNMEDMQIELGVESVMAIEDIGAAWTQLLSAYERDNPDLPEYKKE